MNALEAFIAAHDVTVMWLTASLFNAVIDDRPQALARIRDLLIGGEALSVPHVRRGLSELPDTRIINGYGPTETTTFACAHVISADDVEGARSIPIGRPLMNTRVYVLDADRQLLPPGEAGELWIGGDGVARGYVNDEALTAARFAPDPFVEEADARMYGTGDRVRFLSNGTLEFLGRFDDQIKLRGFRIEPGEVEASLLQHPGVSRAVVGAVDVPPTGRALVAFVVPATANGRGARSLSISELRDFLKERLPDHMVPSRWVVLDAFPLLSTGKTDRRAVLALAVKPMVQPQQRPGTSLPPLLESIAAIWRHVLGVADVGIDDDFFDLGGHSLLATQVLSRIQADIRRGDRSPLAVFGADRCRAGPCRRRRVPVCCRFGAGHTARVARDTAPALVRTTAHLVPPAVARREWRVQRADRAQARRRARHRCSDSRPAGDRRSSRSPADGVSFH